MRGTHSSPALLNTAVNGRHRQVLCQCISYHFVGPTLLQLDEPVLPELVGLAAAPLERGSRRCRL